MKEGGSKGCKNGWVSLQHRLLSPIFICIYIIWFLPSLQEIHFRLCNFFHYDGDLKTSWRFFFCYGFLVSSTTLYAISTSFCYLFKQILLSLFSFTYFGYKLPLFWTSSYCATSISTQKIGTYCDLFLFLLVLFVLFEGIVLLLLLLLDG